MKKLTVCLLVATIATLSYGPAHAEGSIKSGAKKCGNAIAWPFKKIGAGFKSVGSGIKKTFSK